MAGGAGDALVCSELLRDLESVRYAGYRIPHPLEPKLIIKVQTTDSPEERRSDSRSRRSAAGSTMGTSKTSPARAVVAACDRLSAELVAIEKAFETAAREYLGGERDGMDGAGSRTPRLGAMTPAH
jgi:DNA-directed RNA polymerase subunit L